MTIGLYMHNFRSYLDNYFTIQNGINFICGPNGSGKTNMMEAISLLAPGRGLRGTRLAEMSRYSTNSWQISFSIKDCLSCIQETPISINYENGKKLIRYNDSKLASSEILEIIGISWLTPQIMFSFWKDSKVRRNFIDRITSNCTATHLYYCHRYEQVKLEYSRLLSSKSDDEAAYHAIEQLLISHGTKIISNRQKMVKEINELISGLPWFSKCSVKVSDGIANSTNEKWMQSLQQARRSNITMFPGPHRAEVDLLLGDISGHDCSTGEQQLLIIILLLSSFLLLKQDTKILILDDIFAHLDLKNRGIISSLLEEICPTYTLITHHDRLANHWSIIDLTCEPGLITAAQ